VAAASLGIALVLGLAGRHGQAVAVALARGVAQAYTT
jgi:hypothetical protein